MAVTLDAPKDAVGPTPNETIGTVAGLQLAALLKSPSPGLASQVASCAAAGITAKNDPRHNAADASRPMRNRRIMARDFWPGCVKKDRCARSNRADTLRNSN